MRARIENTILLIQHDDLPAFKKGGSVVRNSYFWSLPGISGSVKAPEKQQRSCVLRASDRG
jgi:hypothetical protein